MNIIKIFFYRFFFIDFINYILFVIFYANLTKKEKLNLNKIFLNLKSKFKKKFKLKKKQTNELCIFNLMFGYRDFYTTTFYLIILKLFEFYNLKTGVFSSFKFLPGIKSLNTSPLPPLLSYAPLKLYSLKKFKNINDIKKYKYKNVSCGKIALSSTFRELNKDQFNLKNVNHIEILTKYIKRSQSYVDAVLNFISNHKVKAAIFSDPGYVGQGELFQILTQKNINCYQFIIFTGHNNIIFKKYNKSNSTDHFDKIEKDYWLKIKKSFKSKKKINKLVIKKLQNLYSKKLWYPSVGTTLNEKRFSKKEIYKKLGFKKKKPLGVIFNHIFWDGTFFYGNDLFDTYKEWFEETCKTASKNKNINWLIKPHPANIVQMKRNNFHFNSKLEEEVILYKLFGNILPDNIKIIKHSDKISSLDLYQILDYCITVRGTTGLESAVFGKDVILAGSGRYDNLGFTKDFKSKFKYLNFIKRLKGNKKKNIETTRLASYYAYIIYFKKSLNLKSINIKFAKNKTADMSLDLNFKNFYDLKKNNDLKKIVNWINSNKNEYINDLNE